MVNLNGLSKRIGSEAKSILSAISNISAGSNKKASETTDSPSIKEPLQRILSMPDSVLHSITASISGSALIEEIPGTSSKLDDISLSAQSEPALPPEQKSWKKRAQKYVSSILFDFEIFLSLKFLTVYASKFFRGRIPNHQYNDSVPRSRGIISSWLNMFTDDDDVYSIDDDDAFYCSDESSNVDATSSYDDGSTNIDQLDTVDDESTNIGASSTYDDRSTNIGEEFICKDISSNDIDQPSVTDEKSPEIQDERLETVSGVPCPISEDSPEGNDELRQHNLENKSDSGTKEHLSENIVGEVSRDAVICLHDEECEKDTLRSNLETQDENETQDNELEDAKTETENCNVEETAANINHESETADDIETEEKETDVLNLDKVEDSMSLESVNEK
jgi:hypothetical protein